MLKYLSLLILLSFPTMARSDIYHSISSSVQLDVNAAATAADRIGNSLSISGTGVNTTDGTTTGSVGGLGASTNGVNAYTPITASQLTGGDAFSFSSSYTAGDTVATSLTVGEVSPFGDLTSTSAGTAGSLAGTIDTKSDLTIVAGGAGTSVTGQFVVGLTLD
tara:strand:+ start:3515 stop:4003 length:489 start_codon:yes stop_codon:yes gene_type:complete